MKLFGNFSIQIKVMLAVLLTGVAVLVVSSLSFFVNDLVLFGQSKIQDNFTIANIVGTNCSAALAFDDAKAAEETLRALKFKPHAVAACIYSKNGRLFSQFLRTGEQIKFPSDPGPVGWRLERRHLITVSAITLGDEDIGFVYLETDLRELLIRFRRYTLLVFILIFSSFLLIYVLSSKFQKLISRPILELANTAKAISEKQDYSLRVRRYGQDELGRLTEAFNQMLDQIQQRDDALRRANQELEMRVEERTKELTRLNEELRRHAVELESSNKELDSFSYAVSHDLKAPLRGIANLSEWLLQDHSAQLDGEGKEQLKMLHSRACYMQTLINGILEYSRIGRVREDIEEIDLKDVVDHVVDLLQPPPNIRVEVSSALPKIHAEKFRIHQLFQNLIGNAIKFMDKPEGVVRISCEAAGPLWRFSVSDNGPGIDQKYFDKIFLLFQTLESHDKTDSTGVGLALVKKIIDLYGGSVWVESEVGRGSTFFFTLPK